ncbi:MAG: hypothetical protein Tsb007_09890 [Rhizobacter sp.]
MIQKQQLGKRVAWTAITGGFVVVAGLLLVGCSKSADKPASQVAVKVNREELTIHQVNLLLEQQRALRPDQVEAARKFALERLIDQELAVQKATEIKLDRSPRVMQKIEAARRDIIARAYLERVGEGASKPSEAMIYKYYTDNPALFSERRVYQLQEWFIEVDPAQADAVRAKAQTTKVATEFTDYLRASNLKFESNQAIRAAEQLPLGHLAAFAKMNDGETTINTTPNGLQVVTLVGSRREPVEISRVKPVIEQYLLNEQKTRIIADDIKALRNAATIKYVGGFADAASGAAPTAADAASNNASNVK